MLRTEPALYAANGVAEEAIFNVKRKTCDNDQAACNYTTQFGNNVTLPTAPQPTFTTTPIFQVKVPPNTAFDTANTYDFYDPAAPIGGSGYGRLKLTYLSTGNTSPLMVWLCQFDVSGNTPYNSTPCTSQSETLLSGQVSYWPYNIAPVHPGDAVGLTTWTLDPSMQQRLILYNPYPNNNIFVSIETFGPETALGAGDWPPKGLPYAGQTAVIINAVNGAVGRKIRVVVPNSGGSSPSIPSSVAYVQSANWRIVGSPESNSFNSNNTLGNTIVVAIAKPNKTDTVTNVTDTKGNTYIHALNSSSSYVDIWYAPNIVAGANTVNVIGLGVGGEFTMVEYSGLGSNPVLDGVTFANSAANGNSGNIVTTASGLLFGYAIDNLPITAGAGQNTRQTYSFYQYTQTEDQLNQPAGTHNANFTGGGGGFGTMAIIGLKP